MWRNSREDVWDELNLPQMKEEWIVLRFTDTESEWYK